MYSIRLSDIAKKLNATLYGDGDIIITGIASIYHANSGQITFLSKNKNRKKLISCQASAIILTKENLPFCNHAALVVDNPYLAYAYIAQIMDTTPKPIQKISTQACIASNVIIGKNVTIGDNTIIESGVILEDQVILESGCFIGKNTKIGHNTHIFSNVSIYHNVDIGQYCAIQSHTVIGSNGFGYANDRNHWIKIPQLGRVIIGNKVEIGSCTTIDRGSLDNTIIKNGVIIDNHCHIAHNVIIDDNTAIAGGVVIAGSTKIGKCCMIGGASVINGHITICDQVTITGMSMVIRSITQSGIYSSGFPSQPNQKWRKTVALVMNINSIHNRIKAIEKKLININDHSSSL